MTSFADVTLSSITTVLTTDHKPSPVTWSPPYNQTTSSVTSPAITSSYGSSNVTLSTYDAWNVTSWNITIDGDTVDAGRAEDAIWILTSTFIIFTMQSGFGLLESGSVSTKNEVNIMVKNAVDVIVGGLAFWIFGYAFGFGTGKYTNPFCGWGYFFMNANKDQMGLVYSKFFFQASFATTATTIVSGAMAERTKLEAYIVFSFLNTLVFCFPAHWVWGSNGWLSQLGYIDIAGGGPVHLVGGVTGLVATLVLKPRHGRFDLKYAPPMGAPTNALLGMFMLWWGWLGFNCGSTFGISGLKWKLAARSAVATLSSSVGGGMVGLTFRSAFSTLMASVAGGFLAIVYSYILHRRKFDVSCLINGILGSLVSITAICALAQPWEGLFIGSIGSLLALTFNQLEEKLRIDDPVGCIGVHAVAGSWGIISVGLFAKHDKLKNVISLKNDLPGLFYGGSFYPLGVQVAGLVAIASWTLIWAFIVLKLIEHTIGLRVSLEEELVGADLIEHTIGEVTYDKKSKTFNCSRAKKSEEPGNKVNGSTKATDGYRTSPMLGFNSATRRKHAYVNSEIYRLVCEFEHREREHKRLGSHTYPKGARKKELMVELPGRASGLRRHHSTKPYSRHWSRWGANPEVGRNLSVGRRFAELFANSGSHARSPEASGTKDESPKRAPDDPGGVDPDSLSRIKLEIGTNPKQNDGTEAPK